jgi:DNA-binding transcriptional LysR family regulator
MKEPRVSVDDLRVFVAVAQTEHVTAAAGRLHLSQPAVSRALARVEDQYGVQLFDRPGHRVRLNAFGRALLGHAQRIVAQSEAAQQEISALLDPHSGPVRIGFLHSLATWLTPGLIRSFRALEPGIEFVLRQNYREEITQMLQDGEIDLLLSARPHLGEPAGWQEIVREQLALLVPPDHRLAERGRMQLAEAADESFVVLTPRSEFRQITDRLCDQAGFSPRIAFEGDELATMHGLVAAGLGVSIVPVVSGQPTGGHLVPLTDPGASRLLGLSWLTHRQLPGPAEAFKSWLVAHAHTEPWT